VLTYSHENNQGIVFPYPITTKLKILLYSTVNLIEIKKIVNGRFLQLFLCLTLNQKPCWWWKANKLATVYAEETSSIPLFHGLEKRR